MTKSSHSTVTVPLLTIGILLILLQSMMLAQTSLPLDVEGDRVTFSTDTDRQYIIETSTDMLNWEQHGATITGSGYPHQHQVPHRVGDLYFVRVHSMPLVNVVEYQLKNGAKIATEADAALISSYDASSGELNVTAADWPHQVGDVVVLPASEGTPRGALVRIVEASEPTADGGRLYLTEPATLTDVLQEGMFQHSLPLTADTMGTPEILFSPVEGGRVARDLLENVTVDASGGTFSISVDDATLISSEHGSLILDGSISISSPAVNLSMVAEEGSNRSFSVRVGSDMATNLEVRGNISLAETTTWELTTIPFATYTVGPVIITPAIKLYAGLTLDVNGEFICRVSQRSSIEYSLSYQRGEGWNFAKNATAETADAVIDASLQVEAELFAGLAVELGLYNQVGPYFGVQGYFGFKADSAHIGTDTPWWTLEAGRRFVYGFDASVLDAGELFENTFGDKTIERLDSNDFYSMETTGDSFWATGITGGDIDEIKSVSATSDGGILAAGHSKSFSDQPGNHYGGWLVKFDGSGGVDWQRSIWIENEDGDGYLQIKDIIAEPLPGGGYVIAGSWAADGAPTLPILLRMDEDGTVRFVKRFDPEPGTRRVAARALQVLSDGSVVLLAEYRMDKDNDGTDERYTALICTGINGDVCWQQIYQPAPDPTTNELRHSIPNAMAATPDGGLAVLAHVSGSNGGTADTKLVLIVSATGSIESARQDQGDGSLGRFGEAGQIAVNSSGNVVFSDWNNVVWLAADGSTRWAKHYNLVVIESMTTVGDTTVVAGELANVGAWVAELTAEGEMPVSRVFTRPATWRYVASDVVAHSDGGYTLGMREWGGFSPSEFWVVRSASGGTIDFDAGNGADVDFAAISSRDGAAEQSALTVTTADLNEVGLTANDAAVVITDTNASPVAWATDQ